VIIETRKIKTKYTRLSKTGVSHTYYRNKTLVVLRCDACGTVFERDQGSMNKGRISNQFHHVCSNCNQKAFAQRVGVENRKFWNTPVDSDTEI
jgi:hypothetical protein